MRDGDEWVINGQKIFTTGAQNCQYTFLITRTDPELPKHRGLTMFLVPLDTPGVEIQGIRAFSGERTNVVYYADVRISDRYRLGEVNDGWSVLERPASTRSTASAARSMGWTISRVGVTFLGALERALGAAVDWARTSTRPDGSRPADDPLVQQVIGSVKADLEAAAATTGPMGRVAGSEALVRGAAALIDLVGPAALLPHGARRGRRGGRIDEAHRYAQGTATYGGTVGGVPDHHRPTRAAVAAAGVPGCEGVRPGWSQTMTTAQALNPRTALDLRPGGEAGHFVGGSVPEGDRPVFGGQLLGQLIVAAAAVLPEKQVRSVHATFMRTGAVDVPLDIVADPLHQGRSLATCDIAVVQGGREICHGLVMADASDPDVLDFSEAAEDLDGPERWRSAAELGAAGAEVRFVGDLDVTTSPPARPKWRRGCAGTTRDRRPARPSIRGWRRGSAIRC